VKSIRLVAPFRPFPPESDLHREMASFDWLQALRMMVHSATLSHHGSPVHALTDVDTDLPVPALKYHTSHRRLMLWTLEVCLAYLRSEDFDRDTVMLDVDQLIFQDLSPFFGESRADIGVLVRPGEKHVNTESGQPVLNGVQFWRHKSRKRLVEFYRDALWIADRLPEDRLVWGADTDAVRQLISPIAEGVRLRGHFRVHMINSEEVIETFSSGHADRLAAGDAPWPSRPVLDFRFTRKPHMPAVYRATIGAGAVA